MKKITMALMLVIGLATTVKAQIHYKKDGTPDMRYKENKQIYGTYSTPTYSTPTYSKPTYSKPTTTYTTPTYTSPSYPSNNYSTPYPTKKDGTPDMRYKSNRDLYGY